MNNLVPLLKEFKGRRVAVIGDFVADIFTYGEISRISREAPVLILNQRDTQLVPGGGANAVHNLHALGAVPIPIGIVGNDVEGYMLLNFFRKFGIDTGDSCGETAHFTKTRIGGAVHGQRCSRQARFGRAVEAVPNQLQARPAMP
jgi:bifunctional ADP-heptose synthase (sugar kinase/adenylyltransferase)